MPWYTTPSKKRIWSDTSVPDDQLESWLDEVEPKPPSTWDKVYRAATETPSNVKSFLRSLGEGIEKDRGTYGLAGVGGMGETQFMQPVEQKPPTKTPPPSMPRAALAGWIGGTGEIGTENEYEGIGRMLNPLDVAGMATGFGAAKTGIQAVAGGKKAINALKGLGTAGKITTRAKIARGLDLASRATSLPVMAHGFTEAVHADSTPHERMWGVGELLMGSLGTRSNLPEPKAKAPKKVDFDSPTGKQVVTDQGGVIRDDFPGVIFVDEYTARVEQPTPEVVKKLIKEGWKGGIGPDGVPTMNKPRPQGQTVAPPAAPVVPPPVTPTRAGQAVPPTTAPHPADIPTVNRPYTEQDYAMDEAYERAKQGPSQGPRVIGQGNEPLFAQEGADIPFAPGQIDPRITGLAPEPIPDVGPPPETMPPSGEMGPISRGYTTPEITTPNMMESQRFGNQVVGDTADDINRAIVEMNQRRAAQRAEIDAQTQPQEPKIRTETDMNGNTRVWVNDQEYTGNFGPGGPTAADIRTLHSQIAQPDAYRRLEELKAQQAGTELEGMTPVPPRGRGIEEPSGMAQQALPPGRNEQDFLDSINWQREPGPVGMAPREVSDIIRDVTRQQVDVLGPTGQPISPRAERTINPEVEGPRLTPEQIKELDAKREAVLAKWEPVHQNMAIYEGGNINDIHTPLTPNQQAIRASWERMREKMHEYSAWFSEQEELLPEGEYFEPPPEIKAAHEAEYYRMNAEHNALVERLEGKLLRRLRQQQKLPDIDIEPSAMAAGYRHPTAQNWAARKAELDARNAPDTAYRDIMSTAGKASLKKGETWRDRVQQGIDYFESKTPPDTSASIQNPTSKTYLDIVRDLDAKNMPDTAYRAILPTDKQLPLQAGETWRARVVKELTDLELQTRREIAEKATAATTPDAREQELTRIYNEMQLASDDPNIVAYDTGGRLTPDEMKNMANSPTMKAIHKVMVDVLAKISELIPERALLGKLEHVGHLFDEKLRGVNIQNPEDPKKFAILINIFSRMSSKSPAQAARGIVHILAHEFTHIGIREEGDKFTAFFADVMERWPLEMQYAAQKQIESIIADSAGNYTPEIQALLQRYTDSRGRAATSGDVLIRKRGSSGAEAAGPEGIPSSNKPDGGRTAAEKFQDYMKAPAEEVVVKPILRGNLKSTMRSLGKGRIIKKGQAGVVYQLENGTNVKIPFKEGMGRQIYNTSRGLIASMDISAPFRQGLPLVGTAAWMKAWKPMFQSLWSEDAYRAIMDNIQSKQFFKQREKLVYDRRTGQRVLRDRPSFAEEVGVRLSEMDSITAKEENIMGGLAEKIPGVRASNRAYTAFLNSLRADTFERMMEFAAKEGLNPTQDLQVAKSIADFVNDATGRGSLKVTMFGKEYSAEPAAKIMSDVLFSPRLMASRVRFMNPGNYVFQNKAVRQEYLKSIGRIAVAWTAFASLMKLGGAEVSLDPTNSDFGKARDGNTRIDPAGGIQQYIVAFMRMVTGLKTISTTEKSQEMGAGYGNPVRFDTAVEFGINKLHPVMKFAVDAMRASQYKKFNVADRTLSLFLPALAQDTLEMLQGDPSLLKALAIPASAVGMGSQTYDIGETQGKIIPQEWDYQFEGGALPYLEPGTFENWKM